MDDVFRIGLAFVLFFFAGVITIASASAQGDTTPPSVTIDEINVLDRYCEADIEVVEFQVLVAATDDVALKRIAAIATGYEESAAGREASDTEYSAIVDVVVRGPEDTLSFVASAFDTSDNIGESAPVTFTLPQSTSECTQATVDSVNPSVTIDSVELANRVCDGEVEQLEFSVTVSAIDDVALTLVNASLDGYEEVVASEEVSGAAATATLGLAVRGYDQPTAQIIAGARDTSGNFGNATREFAIPTGSGCNSASGSATATPAPTTGAQATATAAPTSGAQPTATPSQDNAGGTAEKPQPTAEKPQPTATTPPKKPGDSSQPALAYTGTDSTTLAVAGTGLVIAGLGLAISVRRRRH